MSTGSQSFAKTTQGPDVLGELLHSLSQPLTSLRCSLELSIDENAEKQQRTVSVALQQTDKVIGMIQLLREYLDAEQPAAKVLSTALAPTLLSVIENLSSIAVVRGIRLRLVGTCTTTLPVPEERLRLALQYLIASIMEAQVAGGKVTLLLGEGPAGAVLRAEGDRSPGAGEVRDTAPSATSPRMNRDMAGAAPSPVSTSTLRRVRLSIASRVLESAGASLVFSGDSDNYAGFVLRVPHRIVLSNR
jgi:signal transduction histidine kinase